MKGIGIQTLGTRDLNMRQKESAYLHVKSLWIDLALIEFAVFSFPFLKITSILNDAQTNRYSGNKQKQTKIAQGSSRGIYL